MIETFGHNEPNPILQYNNNPVSLTGDGKIDMPYLKALIDLLPQKYGISTWLHKTDVYKYATEHRGRVRSAMHRRNYQANGISY